MSSEAVSLVGLDKFKLCQKKYADGNVYISALLSDDQLIGLDVRFFREDGDKLIPTRNGFRVPAASLKRFVETILKNYEDLDGAFHETKALSLHARYLNDDYGDAIDIRYYKRSDTYSGWEKRGLRLRLSDFLQLQQSVRQLSVVNFLPKDRVSLFGTKTIVDTSDKRAQVGERQSITAAHHADITKSKAPYINEVLLEILR